MGERSKSTGFIMGVVALLLLVGLARASDVPVDLTPKAPEDPPPVGAEPAIPLDSAAAAPMGGAVDMVAEVNSSNGSNATGVNLTFNRSNDTRVVDAGLTESDNSSTFEGIPLPDPYQSAYEYKPYTLDDPANSKYIIETPDIDIQDVGLATPGSGSYEVPNVALKLDPRFPLGPKQQHQSRARACSCCYKWATAYGKDPQCATGLCTCKDQSKPHEVQGKYCFSDLGVESFREGTEPMECSEEEMMANQCDF